MNVMNGDAKRSVGIMAVAMVLVFLLAGCRSGVSMHVDGAYQPRPRGGVDFGKYNQTPAPRLGSLPYPGMFTLFEAGDPKDLGDHAYDEQTGNREEERGILYTCRGGFIDIAHARKTIDLCKYAAVRAELALLNDWTAFRLKSLEPSIFIVHLQYPPNWKNLSRIEKQVLARELSIRIGQRVAWIMITWHEVLTWFGWQSSPIVSERQSAFTYDDTDSHALGILVGGRALRDPRPWDRAVTSALDFTLQELGVVNPEQTVWAAERVRGLWWSGFDPLKRHIELGWDGRPFEAWIVRDLPFCSYPMPHRYQLPRLDDVMGVNFGNLMRIEVHPNVGEGSKISRVLPGKPSVIDVDLHMQLIIDHIRQYHLKNDGEQSLRPY
jgi:hypothetical protein